MVVARLYRTDVIALVLHDHFSPKDRILVEVESILQGLQHQADLFLQLTPVRSVEQHRYFVGVDWSDLRLLRLCFLLHLGLVCALPRWAIRREHRHIFGEVRVLFEDGNIRRAIDELIDVEAEEFLILFQLLTDFLLSLEGPLCEVENILGELEPFAVGFDQIRL